MYVALDTYYYTLYETLYKVTSFKVKSKTT